MPDRIVRFTEEFFERLDALFSSERGAGGEPSRTDVMLLELPAIRDALAVDFEGTTLPTADPDVRVYIAVGVLMSRLAVYAVADTSSVEVIWISVDHSWPD